MPISGTHSIVGATIGFSVVLRGPNSFDWFGLIRIVVSWFASPLVSGAISSLIYMVIHKSIVKKVDPLPSGLKALPLFYGLTVFINVASIVIDGPKVFGLNELPWYAGVFISLACAAVAMCCVGFILAPKLKRDILDELVARAKRAPFGGSDGPLNLARQSAQLRTTSFSGDKAAGGGGGHDNATFELDEPQQSAARGGGGGRRRGRRLAGGSAASAPPKPRREPHKLDASELAAADEEEDAQRPQKAPSAAATGPRPPITPKPAHLSRLPPPAPSSAADQLEEVDLSNPAGCGPSASGGGGGGGRKSPAAPSTIVAIAAAAAPQQQPFGFYEGGERLEVTRLFASLQIMTACFASFAHGTNDVSNAVAPLIPIWNIYAHGEESPQRQPTEIWILLFGGIGICAGLWAWGRAVMGTVSEGLVKLTASRGFSIELGAAVSVLCASKFGLPISTTHCKVGSLVIVGLVASRLGARERRLAARAAQLEARRASSPALQQQQLEIVDTRNDAPANDDDVDEDEKVDWKMFGNIALTWIVTVPLAALASAIVMLLLKWLLL